MSNNAHIIIADALQHVANDLSTEFKYKGYACHICDKNTSLLKLIKTVQPELVVTEMRLTDGPALPAIKLIINKYPKTRVVVLTGHGSVATAVKCSHIGVSDYLIKPATVDQIIESLLDIKNEYISIPQKPNSLDLARWEYINTVVEMAGSISKGAELLGVDRRSLRRMLAKYAPRH